MDLLKAQTQNLPAWLKEPLVDILGPQCFQQLVHDVNLSDTTCLKFALSKGLSLGMVAGGGILKVPQIVAILRSKSARGLSLSSYLLDTASLVIFDAYNMRLGFPLVSYAENLAILGQNVVIVSLIFALGTSAARTSSSVALPAVQMLAFTAVVAGSLYALYHLVSLQLLTTLFTLSIPLSVLSKLPQIVANFRAGPGQLSTFLVVASFLGTAARLYTSQFDLILRMMSSQETRDPLLTGNYALASALNGVLALQVLSANNGSSSSSLNSKAKRQLTQPAVELQSVAGTPSPSPAPAPAPATPKAGLYGAQPISRTPTPSSVRSNRTPSKQWVRKAD